MAQHSGFFVGPAASELVSMLLAFDAALNAIRQGPLASAFVIKNDNQNVVDWVNGTDPSSQAGLKSMALVTLAWRRLLLLRQLAPVDRGGPQGGFRAQRRAPRCPLPLAGIAEHALGSNGARVGPADPGGAA